MEARLQRLKEGLLELLAGTTALQNNWDAKQMHPDEIKRVEAFESCCQYK